MITILKLQKLHIKKQLLPYLFPIIFIYVFLLPYQKQLLLNMDETAMIKVFDSAQEYLLLFAVWFQYLGLRIVLNPGLKEASVSYCKKIKGKWLLSNWFLYFLCFLPYALWVILNSGSYYKNMLFILIQCMMVAVMAFFIMYILQSALAGLAVMVLYYFLCVNHIMVEPLCIIRLGILPENYSFGWYVWTLAIESAVVILGDRINYFIQNRYKI